MPSFLNELMIKEAERALSGVTAMLVIDASRLKAGEVIKFRNDLRKIGAKLKVGKSSLLYRVLPAGTDKAIPPKGAIGLVIPGEDIASAAKLVNDLAKEDKVTLKGGLLEGKALDAKQAKAMANLPTRDQANASVVRVLQAQLTQLIRILNVKPTELVRVLKVKADEANPT